MKKIVSLIVVLALSAALLIGCSVPTQKHTATQTHPNTLSREDFEVPSAGGVLFLKVNPEIALHYDADGKVTQVEGRNADGVKLLENFTGYAGKDTAQVLESLVERIGEAGYFVEEVDGTARKIVLELDPGSQVPHEQFLQDMADHVKSCVEGKNWVGEKAYEYSEQPRQQNQEIPAASEPAPAQPKIVPAVKEPTEQKPVKPIVALCQICGDDDCDDGAYCDDGDELAENLQEAENRKNGTPCKICGEYDCDDGAYCDDGDELAENLREAENRKNGTPCEICGEYDCDDGIYCDDRWDDDDDHDDDHDDDDRHGRHGRHHDD